ncbi:sensor histidine kinase [Ammoniphilus resinae]|uniref:histidine kinase n=1 Tax=Ammoniphilus resinae TaxID=861532 RepID=A0ABS4GVY1_9BACL|nr:HAMP domain-containing sensor histidine kinase [Ammoniphilus resinae]MBP1934416.1 two-component system sporulation sensor kinase B [Ammoniphilus resinae]
MEDFIKTLMTNFMFICIPPIVYFLYWTNIEKKNDRFPSLLIFVGLSISMILCMSFPVRYMEHYTFDFRQVLLVLGVFYGGARIGGALLIILLTYRYLIGGDGFYIALFVSGTLYVSLLYIKSKFELNSRYKIFLALMVSTIIIPLLLKFVLYLGNFYSLKALFLFSSFIIVQSIVLCLLIYLIEFVIDHFKMEKQLQEAEKMRVVSEIAASVSHEVRNPLTTVKGMLQLLGDVDLSQEKKQEFVRLALTELNSAVNIISDYLTFAKPQLTNIMHLNLAHECRHVVNVLTPYANFHQVDLIYKSNNDCMIIGDSQKLRQSLINLIKNCIEASHKGTVEITTSAIGEVAVIKIRDTGIGMSKEQIKRLGTPYYSTKEKGTGLGTMVSFSLIKAMSGAITIESEIDKGSLFVISFPSLDDAETPG